MCASRSPVGEGRVGYQDGRWRVKVGRRKSSLNGREEEPGLSGRGPLLGISSISFVCKQEGVVS